MEEYNVMQYPEGVDKAKEYLAFLPEIDVVRDAFMDSLLFFLVSM